MEKVTPFCSFWQSEQTRGIQRCWLEINFWPWGQNYMASETFHFRYCSRNVWEGSLDFVLRGEMRGGSWGATRFLETMFIADTVARLEDGFWWSLPPGIHTPKQFSDTLFQSSKTKYGTNHGMPFLKSGDKRLWLPLGLFPTFQPLPYHSLRESSVLSLSSLRKRFTWSELAGLPAASEELRSTNHCVCELGSRLTTPSRAVTWPQFQPTAWQHYRERLWAKTTQLNYTWVPK